MMLILVLFSYLSAFAAAQTQDLQIGGIFHNENDTKAFKLAANLINSKYPDAPIRLIPRSFSTSTHDTYTIFTQTCKLLRSGVAGIFGPSSVLSSPYIQNLLDRKEIPHVETHWDRGLSRQSCLLNLHPHSLVLVKALHDIVKMWNWQSFVVIYDSDEALSKMASFVTLHEKRMSLVRLALDHHNTYRDSLIKIRKTGETNVLLDCSIDILETVLRQAQQVGMLTERHSYVIANLDLQTINLEPFQFSGTNITGFRVVNPEDKKVADLSRKIFRKDYQEVPPERRLKLETALIFDSIELFYEAVLDLTLSKRIVIKTQPLCCNDSRNWNSGHTIVNYMKGKIFLGLTGIVNFDHEGFRQDFSLDILELSSRGLQTVGNWVSYAGVTLSRRAPLVEKVEEEEGNLANKTFTVITCLTTPYGMLKEDTTPLHGNDRFEGFGIDLIEELSKMLGFNYTIIIQEDGYNGNYDPDTNEWNGLIGAIIAGKADLAIADLTVTAERERAVDFTLQFMNLGISILYKKPKPVPPSLFMFVSPFSYTVWILLVVTYFVVSLCFFVMGRLSPSEWTNPYPCIEEPQFLINQFSIRNSLWFTIGSLMQQGTEIAPIAVSTRAGAGVWWFFTLIIVSSYTANLAAFLTVETLVTPFSNVKELSEQTEIKYGAKREGATANFFKNAGRDVVRQKIWKHMEEHDDEMTESNDEGVERTENEHYAFFMESTTIEYVVERHCSLASVGPPLDDKGYAIAMKKNSSYRHVLSQSILKLQENGKLSALKEKWWKEKRGASNCGAHKEENEATALNLQNVGGVFLVLFVGTIIGFFLSLGELGGKVYLLTKKSGRCFKEDFKKELKFFLKFKQNVKNVGTD